MKSFKFSLESVLKIKNQLQDVLKLEYANILLEVSTQEEYIKTLEKELEIKNTECNKKNAVGMASFEIAMYKHYFKKQHGVIEKSYVKLDKLNVKLIEKREEIILSNQEISSLDNLKEKRLFEYEESAKKAEELFIEEFVSNKSR